MWRNDTKCKYMFMFPMRNLAHKGLMNAEHKAQHIPISTLHQIIHCTFADRNLELCFKCFRDCFTRFEKQEYGYPLTSIIIYHNQPGSEKSLHTPKHPHFTHGEKSWWVGNGHISISSTNGFRWTRDTSPLAGCWIPVVLTTSCERAGKFAMRDWEPKITHSDQKIC